MIKLPNSFRAFSQRSNGLARQIISEVHVTDAIQKDRENLKQVKCNGLWDTGATNTVISKKIVEELKLPVISKTPILGVTGTIETTTHVIDLWLPDNVVVKRLPVMAGSLTSDIDVLIGMDVIVCGDFALSNFQSKTVFSYRLPSIAETDYVKHSQLIQQAKRTKIERNAPCPCGSGRKYKHCCGKK